MKNIRTHLQPKYRTLSYLLLFIGTVGLCFTSQVIFANKAEAAFTNNHFIDDAMFLDANAMNADSIQAFLNTKSGALKSSNFLLDCDIAGATAKQMYLSVGAPCGQTISAARIIYYSSQIYGVNPRVILTTMQKEQSLITNPSPTAWGFNQAMGYGCPDSGSCNSDSGFFYQIDNGTWVLRYHYERANGNNSWWNTRAWACNTAKIYYSPNLYPKQNVNFYDDNKTFYTTIYLENAATAAFYCYTPHAYNNPQGLYGRAAFGTTGMYYSGSYNFVYYYELWFGSTYSFIYNGTSYSNVFDPTYYLNANPDLKAAFGTNQNAAFNHFIKDGMREGRQGNADFNVTSYRNRYPDLRWAFGTNLSAYYWHYLVTGRAEGRVATGTVALQPVTYYGGVDYSSIYNFSAYLANNPDVRTAYANDDTGALWHFVTNGMREGRQGNVDFNVTSYLNRYPDLRTAFGTSNLRNYYIHYMVTGKVEGRVATGTYLGGTSIADKVNYSAIYDFDYYAKNNPDVSKVFGINDGATLQHFINTGMVEGRQASASFNVNAYKAANGDLQRAFGNNLKLYYMHYLQTGKAEGRSGV